jgi:hypothetical protein
MFVFSLVLFGMYRSQISPAVLIFPLILIIGSIWVTVNIIKRKIIIYDDRILLINAFSIKEVAIANIRGARVGEKVIYLELLSETDNKVTITNYIDFMDSDGLAKYFKENFQDLNSLDLVAEKQRMLKNNELGYTEGERQQKLVNARNIATAYNITGMIIGFSMIFADSNPAVLTLLLYPVVGLLIIVFSNGLIKFLSDSKRSVYAFVMLGFVLPCFILLIKSLFSFSLFNINHLWFPAFAISAVVFSLLYIFGINKSVPPIAGQAIVMLIVAVIYGFGSARQINCQFDESKPEVYKAAVFDHRVVHGKSNSYYLTLSKWGPSNKIGEVEIQGGLYRNVNIGDTVHVNYKKGLLNIPWFTISK